VVLARNDDDDECQPFFELLNVEHTFADVCIVQRQHAKFQIKIVFIWSE